MKHVLFNVCTLVMLSENVSIIFISLSKFGLESSGIFSWASTSYLTG
jgi:hypothetical protein